MFPVECAKAAAEAHPTDGEEKKWAKKIPAGQPESQAQRECDLNRVYDLEKVGRTGKCTTTRLRGTAHHAHSFFTQNVSTIIIGSGTVWCWT